MTIQAGIFTGQSATIRVAAVLVLFDQQSCALKKLDVLLARFHHLIVVDNTPTGFTGLDTLELPGLTILRNGNRGLLAGAYNCALDCLRETPDLLVSHVLFLDDDSDADAIFSFMTSKFTTYYLNQSDVAAIAPLYVERETGLPGAHIQLSRWVFKVLPREPSAPVEVAFLINSMSLWRLCVLDEVGPYNESLGLDHIDTEYCLRAQQFGYRLILNPAVRYWHSIGQRKSYTLFGKQLQSGGHDSVRRQAIGRNTVLLAKHFGWRCPSFLSLCLIRLVYEAIGILRAETFKLPKLMGLSRGLVEGLFQPYRGYGENRRLTESDNDS